MSAAACSISVSGRIPIRTTQAAPSPSRPRISSITPASMVSSWSVVCCTSSREEPNRAYPPVSPIARAMTRQSVPSGLEIVYGFGLAARAATSANDGMAGRASLTGVVRSGSRVPSAR